MTLDPRDADPLHVPEPEPEVRLNTFGCFWLVALSAMSAATVAVLALAFLL